MGKQRTGVDRTDAELCETLRSRQREVQHEIPNRDMGCCGLSCCKWLGGLFFSKKQGPPGFVKNGLRLTLTIEPLVSALLRLTCPIAIVGMHHPVSIYSSLAAMQWSVYWWKPCGVNLTT